MLSFIVFVGVSQSVRQDTKLKMSTEGFDMGRFEYFHVIIHADSSRGGRGFTSVCLSVCYSA